MNVLTLPLSTDRGFTWSDEETIVLLELWNNIDIETNSSRVKRNAVIYEQIAEAMNRLGFVRTASQCKEKIKRMKREYNLTKQKNRSGKRKKSMRFYDLFEKFLLEKQNKDSNIEVAEISDKSESDSVAPKRKKTAPPDAKTSNNQKIIQPIKKETSDSWTPDALTDKDLLPPSLGNWESSSTCSENGAKTQIKKKKFNSHLMLLKSVIDSLAEKFIKYQTDSDAKMLSKIEELENQRNTMNERIQKMWTDFEERRKIDEKEHELNVMSAYKNIIDRTNNSSPTSKC